MEIVWDFVHRNIPPPHLHRKVHRGEPPRSMRKSARIFFGDFGVLVGLSQ
jgi:hypothetical protein